MYENPTDHGRASFDAPTAPVPPRRPSLLAAHPVDERPQMPARLQEPVVYPAPILDRFDGKTWGLLASAALASLLLVAVALSLFSGSDDTSTAAGPGVTMPASPSLASPDPSSGAAAGLDPSDNGAPTSQATLGDESSTTSILSTTTMPPTTSTTAAPTTVATTVSTTPPTTAASTTESTTTAPSSTDPTSAETTMLSTTEPPPTTADSTTTTIRPGPSGDDSVIQQQVLDATNAERAANGCPPLRMDPLLNQVADGHSEDMAARGYFDHINLDGQDPGDRIRAANYPARGWAENIAAGYGSAEAVVDGWMDSPGHRTNILNCSLDEIGIGYAEPGRYWTQLFARRG